MVGFLAKNKWLKATKELNKSYVYMNNRMFAMCLWSKGEPKPTCLLLIDNDGLDGY